jgi:hypothetical protein
MSPKKTVRGRHLLKETAEGEGSSDPESLSSGSDGDELQDAKRPRRGPQGPPQVPPQAPDVELPRVNQSTAAQRERLEEMVFNPVVMNPIVEDANDILNPYGEQLKAIQISEDSIKYLQGQFAQTGSKQNDVSVRKHALYAVTVELLDNFAAEKERRADHDSDDSDYDSDSVMYEVSLPAAIDKGARSMGIGHEHLSNWYRYYNKHGKILEPGRSTSSLC